MILFAAQATRSAVLFRASGGVGGQRVFVNSHQNQENNGRLHRNMLCHNFISFTPNIVPKRLQVALAEEE